MLTRSQGRANLLTGSQGPYELREPLLKIQEAVGGQKRESAVLETEMSLRLRDSWCGPAGTRETWFYFCLQMFDPYQTSLFLGVGECKTIHQ